MSNLDEIIKDILNNAYWYEDGLNPSGNEDRDNAVKDIKQAFKDAHWAAIPEEEVYDRVLKYDNQVICTSCQNRFSSMEDCRLHQQLHPPTMTGQEWYMKFQKEFTDAFMEDKRRMVSPGVSWIYDVAKKAVGIE